MENNLLEQINFTTFSAINQFAGHFPVIDSIAILASEYMPYIFLLPVIYLLVSSKDNYRKYALFAGYSVVLGLILNFVITLIYYHPRPFMEGIGYTLVKHQPETSFPSDHTTLMLSAALMLIFFPSTRIIGCILTLLGLIGGIARVYCGLHFPFDIAGSLFVAFIAAIVVWFFREKLAFVHRFIIGRCKRMVGFSRA